MCVLGKQTFVVKDVYFIQCIEAPSPSPRLLRSADGRKQRDWRVRHLPGGAVCVRNMEGGGWYVHKHKVTYTNTHTH